MSFDFKLKKFLSGFEGPCSRRNAVWLSACTVADIETLLTYPVSEELLFAHIDALYSRRQSFWDSMTAEYLEGYLAGDILVKTDRASMAHSLEVRAPFLDTRIVDFALGLKPEYKYHGKTGKYILKRAMEGLLPHHILYRSKQGFNIPIGSWIKGAQRQLFEDVLLGGPLVASGLFKQKSLAILMESHVAGTVDNRKKLWSLFVLALWMEKWQ